MNTKFFVVGAIAAALIAGRQWRRRQQQQHGLKSTQPVSIMPTGSMAAVCTENLNPHIMVMKAANGHKSAGEMNCLAVNDPNRTTATGSSLTISHRLQAEDVVQPQRIK